MPLHKTTKALGPSEVVSREGIRVTDPARSILDATGAGTAPEQIEMAARQALGEGTATRRSLLARADQRGGRVAELVRGAVDQDGQFARSASTVSRASKASSSVPAPGRSNAAGHLFGWSRDRSSARRRRRGGIHGNRRRSSADRRPFGHSCPMTLPLPAGSPTGQKRKSPRRAGASESGARRIRTADLLGAIQALCQLSYSPEGLRGIGLGSCAQVLARKRITA